MHLKIVLREWMASTITNNNSTMRRFHVDALTHSLQNHTMERNSQKVHFFFLQTIISDNKCVVRSHQFFNAFLWDLRSQNAIEIHNTFTYVYDECISL